MPLQTQAIGVGANDHIFQQIDGVNKAARVSIRGPDVGFLGSYSIALQSGIMAAGLAGAAPIFAFRWSASQVIALIRRVRITAGTDTTAFAQGATIFDLIRASGFSVQDTNGAVITISGRAGARATRYAPSQIQIAASATGNIAVSSTATLTAGTRVLDSNPMGILVASVGAVPSVFPVANTGILYDGSDPRKNELEIGLNEGFVIRATVPATGTWRFGVEVDWDEVDPAKYFT